MWSKFVRHPAFPYSFPFFLCMGFIMARDLHPLAIYVLYPLQTLGVGISIVWLWKRLPSFKPSHFIASLFVGILSVILWIGLDHLIRNCAPSTTTLSQLSKWPWLTSFVENLFLMHEPGTGFNPWLFGSVPLSLLIILFRIAGATLVVPIMEEIFWRGFLMRYLIREDFEKVKLGTYHHFSFIITTGMFALIHGWQWPLGVAVGLLYGGWFVYTKNLGNVILAHAVTNLLLGIYVVKTGEWWFW